MTGSQKTDQGSLPEQTTKPTTTTARVTKVVALSLFIVSSCGTYWTTVAASRGTDSACSPSNNDFRRLQWLLIRSHCSGFLLYLHNIWADEQNKQYAALRHHTSTQSIELLQTPRYFWLLPHIQSPLRRTLAIIASIFVLLLQLMALRFAYQGLWALCVWGFQLTLYRGTCVNGYLVLVSFLVRWGLGTIALLLAVMSWAYILFLTLTWLVVQLPYLTFLFTGEIKWQRKDPESANQCEKAASSDASDDTKQSEGPTASPPVDVSTNSSKGVTSSVVHA